MQPRILTLPDPLRDALERDLTRAFAKNPSIIKTKAHEKEIDIGRQIVAWHLFGIAPRDPGLVTGPGADDAHDPETKQFLKEFYQAYLGMECGTSSPVLQLENLPRRRGALFNIGLMKAITQDGLAVIGTMSGTSAQEAHRDLPTSALHHSLKTIQSLYCQSPGSIKQPTVFVSVDEALDALAKNEGGDVAAARQRWVKALSDIVITSHIPQNSSFIKRNPAFDDANPASPDDKPPEYILAVSGRYLSEYIHVSLSDEQRATLQSFRMAMNDLVTSGANASTGSRKANTMVLWNDALVFHARGPQLAEGAQKNRKLAAAEGTHTPYPDPEGLAFAIGGPCSHIDLTARPSNERMECPEPHHAVPNAVPVR